jgi:1-acyl-sn-glycerol-3-phosphate acyltransferase
MKIIRSAFFYAVAVISFIFGTLLTIFLSWFTSDKTRCFLRSARIWARFLMLISGIPVKVYGAENIPQNEPMIFVSNHQGAMDILILLAYLPVYFRFVVKKELFGIPFFGWYLKRVGYLSVDRGVGEKAHKMFSKAENILGSGGNLLVFPEGTRSLNGEIQPFKRGSLLLAFKAKVRVVPIAVSGSFHILPPKKIIYNIVPVKVKIGKPVSLEKYGSNYEKALEDIHETIKDLL